MKIIRIKYLLQILIVFSMVLAASSCGGGGGGDGSSNSATLTWTAPATTMDGSPLTGTNIITGYKVYYGTSSGNYTVSKDAGNVTTYTVPELSGGTKYFFAVAAVNSSGESGYSDEMSKTIP